MSRKRSLHSFFATKPSTSGAKRKKTTNSVAESLAQRFDCPQIFYLTKDAKSWIILQKKWWTSSPLDFEREWNLHPEIRHKIKLFGKVVEERRWSQSWGVSYAYSGSTNAAKPTEESAMVSELIDKVNDLTKDLMQPAYNGCLENWYQPEDTIGLHSDDERSQRKDYPIFSLSWGGTRRFLFRERSCHSNKMELYLEDGDLLIMGGTTQQTHAHEVPKLRTTMDPPTSNRINWTIRAFVVE